MKNDSPKIMAFTSTGWKVAPVLGTVSSRAFVTLSYISGVLKGYLVLILEKTLESGQFALNSAFIGEFLGKCVFLMTTVVHKKLCNTR